MSANATKVKRKIVPIAIPASAAPMGNLSAAPKQSEVYSSFLKGVSAPGYLESLEKRATELGYQKAKKPKKPRASKPKKGVDPASMKHAEHLSSFKDYAVEFIKLKKHKKGETLHEHLKKHFDKGEYYNTGTKRFRRVK